jgi:dienelactone hydrolase/pimeloyl-ACP methyl ester carboxylesterase
VLTLLGLLIMLDGLQADDAKPAGTAARPTGDMMKQYLLRQVDEAAQRWEADFEARTTPEQIAACQKQLSERLWQVLGGPPFRTPLNARTTGKVQRDGYVVEKVIFESQPGFHVTALLFLPDAARLKPPYPGVVVPVGHTGNGKAWDEYQTMGALLALNGMVGLVYDAIDESERLQYRGERGPFVFDKMWGSELHGTYGHMMIQVGSVLLGRNTAWFEVWDTMRAIDYLQSRPEVDPQRIGLTGHSGGGIITAYVAALDDRVQAAAPSCYLSSLPTVIRTVGPQDAEQQTWAALSAGPQPTDLLMLRAPVPTLFCAASADVYFDIRGSWRAFRYAKRLYARLGFAERIEILETGGPHSYNRLQREGIARWMSRWLLHKDQPITEPPIRLLTDREAQCTPDGQVMLLPGARSAYDLNEDCERGLAGRREAAWASKDRAALLERVRQIAGIRKLDQLPLPQVQNGETVRRPGYRIERLEFRPEEGIVLPAWLFVPEKAPSGRLVLYLHQGGKEADAAPGGRIEQLVLGGARVLAVDLRGTGKTQQTGQGNYALIGTDWKDITTAFCLGRSYVGMRAEDVLTVARHATRHLAGGPVDLVAVGNAGVPALHAAALEPSLFRSVKLSQALVSWASVIRCRLTRLQYANVVHGALLEYDLPNLGATLGDKLTVEDPRDGAGNPK